MPKFKCWNEEDGEDDAIEITTDFTSDVAQDAAIEFADRHWDDTATECGERFTVMVRDPDGTLHRFAVEAEYTINWWAHEREVES